MKFRYLIPIFVLCAAGWAQPNIGAMQNLPNVFTSTNTFQGQVFLSTLPNGCLALTAGLVVSQPCGQTSFALISSGVNTFATMNCGSGCSLLASGSGTIAGTGLANNGNTVVLNGTGITWTDLNHNFISSSSSAVILSFAARFPRSDSVLSYCLSRVAVRVVQHLSRTVTGMLLFWPRPVVEHGISISATRISPARSSIRLGLTLTFSGVR